MNIIPGLRDWFNSQGFPKEYLPRIAVYRGFNFHTGNEGGGFIGLLVSMYCTRDGTDSIAASKIQAAFDLIRDFPHIELLHEFECTPESKHVQFLKDHYLDTYAECVGAQPMSPREVILQYRAGDTGPAVFEYSMSRALDYTVTLKIENGVEMLSPTARGWQMASQVDDYIELNQLDKKSDGTSSVDVEIKSVETPATTKTDNAVARIHPDTWKEWGAPTDCLDLIYEAGKAGISREDLKIALGGKQPSEIIRDLKNSRNAARLFIATRIAELRKKDDEKYFLY